MIKENLKQYAEENWAQYKKTISCITQSGDQKGSLVESEHTLYCFDDITAFLFQKQDKPASVDGIAFYRSATRLIEFKAGYHDIIDDKHYDPQKAMCEETQKECLELKPLLKKIRKKEKSELIDSIRLKAIESYITLEKQILPKCIPQEKKTTVEFWVVTDEEPTDTMKDIYESVSGSKTCCDSPFDQLRKTLQRLSVQKDAEGKDYYYDKIKVISAVEFQKKLEDGQI